MNFLIFIFIYIFHVHEVSRLIFLISVILLFSLLSSCSTKTDNNDLVMADAIMEENPDSALSILQKLEPSILHGENERALYGLLLTQALVKTYHEVTDDSLINLANQYFRRHGSQFNRMRSAFYAGKVDYYRGDYEKAILNATEAHEKAQKIDDPYWLAKTAELLSEIYQMTIHYEEAKLSAKEAAYFYQLAGKMENHFFSMLDIAITLLNEGRYEESIHTTDSLINTSSGTPFERNFQSAAYPILMEALMWQGNINRADSVYKLISSHFIPYAPIFQEITTIINLKLRQADYEGSKQMLSFLKKEASSI